MYLTWPPKPEPRPSMSAMLPTESHKFTSESASGRDADCFAMRRKSTKRLDFKSIVLSLGIFLNRIICVASYTFIHKVIQ